MVLLQSWEDEIGDLNEIYGGGTWTWGDGSNLTNIFQMGWFNHQPEIEVSWN